MCGCAQDFTGEASADPRVVSVQTTLYHLIEAVSDEVQPEEEQLVVAVVSYLIQNHRSECWA